MKSGKMTSVLAIGVAMLLAACSGGGGGGGSTAPAATTAQAKGSVNAGEIGGTGLVVLSAQQATTASVQSSGFTTTVSTQGPQLLFLQDSAGKIRGVTLSLPSSQAAPSIMTADAASTALALLFLSPGVTTSNSAQAKQVVAALPQMTSFASFLAFLKANLPTRALDELVQDATYGTLLTACLTEWPGVAATLPPVPVASVGPLAFAVDPKVTPPSTGGLPQAGGVSITAGSSTQSAKDIPVTIQNFGWRYVKVYKVAYDSNGTFLAAEPLADQEGATALSAGAFLTNTVGSPSSSTNKADFSNNVAKIQYWVVGPGFGPCAQCPVAAESGHGPEGIGNGADQGLWFKSVFVYVSLPVISTLTGIPLGALGDVVGNLQDANGFLSSVMTLLNPTSSPEEAAAALAEGTLSIFNAAIDSGIIKGPGVFSILNPLNKIMGAANMAVAMAWLATMPHVAKVEITAPYDTLEFSAADYTVGKTKNQAIITVMRTDGSMDALTVKYAVSDDTAFAGQDYTATSGTLTFGPKEKSKTFSILLRNNPANLDSRRAKLALTLNDPSDGAKLGSRDTATLTIKANADCAAGPVFNEVACTDIYPVGYWQDPIKSLTMPLALSAQHYMTVGESAIQCCGADSVLFFSLHDYPIVSYLDFAIHIFGYSGSGTYPIKTYPQAVPGGPYAFVATGPNTEWFELHFSSNHCLGGSVTVTETKDPNGARSFRVDVSLTECVSLDSGSHEAGGIVGPVTASFTTTPTLTWEEVVVMLFNTQP